MRPPQGRRAFPACRYRPWRRARPWRGLATQLPALARGNVLRAVAPFAHELAQLRQILIRQKPQCRMVGFFDEGQFIRAEQPAFLLYAASHAQIPPRRAKIQARTRRSFPITAGIAPPSTNVLTRGVGNDSMRA